MDLSEGSDELEPERQRTGSRDVDNLRWNTHPYAVVSFDPGKAPSKPKTRLALLPGPTRNGAARNWETTDENATALSLQSENHGENAKIESFARIETFKIAWAGEDRMKIVSSEEVGVVQLESPARRQSSLMLVHPEESGFSASDKVENETVSRSSSVSISLSFQEERKENQSLARKNAISQTAPSEITALARNENRSEKRDIHELGVSLFSGESDSDSLMAQRGGLFRGLRRSDSSEERRYESSETQSYRPPQKATEISSEFLEESESEESRSPENDEISAPNSDEEDGENEEETPKENGSADPVQDRDQSLQNFLNRSQRVKLDPNSVGNSHSSTLIRMMYDEIINGLKTRNISGRYDMFRNYARSTLDRYSAISTGNEVDGRYRLSWYDRLYRDPVRSVFEVEEFSRTLHAGLSGDHRHLAETMSHIRNKLDITPRNNAIHFSQAQNPKQAVAEVQRCLLNAQAAYTRAISTLSAAEQRDLATNLYPIFAGNVNSGHTIPSRSIGKRLVALLQKMDRAGIHEALESLVPLTDENFLRLLATLPEDAFPTIMIGSQRVQRITTSAGDIIIGGRGNNVYDLDAPGMQNVICVIDLGGNDVYREGTCDINRPVFVIIDLAGDDKYFATKPGVQGGSILGVSMLLDLSGNDTYQAQDVAQGTTLGGVGLLIDYSGHDTYHALRRAQGSALGGVGILIDKKGNDSYHAALHAQGLGHPGGFGVLEDCEGNDRYYLGGLYLDSYPEHPGYDGWGQGLGAGIRQVANGGVGALLDGGGDDNYEFDYFAHGGGYWLGVGFARDFGGNDKRHGATLLDYYGKPRKEARWQRFGCGFGCHYALGFCFDDEGNDSYGGTIMGSGMAWDMAAGFLCDFEGDDRFESTGGMTKGAGAEAGFGVLFNYGGDDVYMGRSFGYANSGISYHSPSNCGSNFSFLIDYGGKDEYGGRQQNNVYLQQGSSGGFLIDRPFDVEAAAEKAAEEKAAAEKAAKEKEAAEQAKNAPEVKTEPTRRDAYGRPIRTNTNPRQQPARTQPQRQVPQQKVDSVPTLKK